MLLLQFLLTRTYQGKNLPQNYITNSLNESIREGKLGVKDINEYIESLRNGAGLR